ncbi:unnamed protein product, partial [Timema podura]|nr:unnamed protein product [Timema podura]
MSQSPAAASLRHISTSLVFYNCPEYWCASLAKTSAVELTVEERNERFPYPPQERFSVLLFSPVSWEVIPNTKMELEEWEHVTCLKNVSLAYEGTTSGLKGYIALGTNYNYGEDITSRGR